MATHVDIDKTIPVDNKDVLVTGISKSALRWFIACLSLILFIAIICLSYSIGVSDVEKGAIPIIRADGGIVKVRPDNPGGKKYPHQDLTIYNSFRDDIADKEIQLKDNLEKPLPFAPAEQKMVEQENQINNLQEVSKTENNSVSTLENSEDLKLKTVSEGQDATQKAMQTNQVETEIHKIVKQAEVVNKEETNKINVLQKTDEKPLSTSGSFLQIGAFRSESDALVGFNRAKAKFSELALTKYIIVKADLGSKGIYYRLRVGPFENKQKSLNVCSTLKSKGQPCLYISQ